MNEPSPCGQICTQSCSTPCTDTPLTLTFTEALARFQREAVRGVCDTGRYRCRFFSWGEGPPLLFIPGLAETSGAYLLPIALLSSSFRCIAYDLPTGREDGSCLKRYTHADLVEDVWALLDHVGAKQSYVFASSFGSTVALAAMKSQPHRVPRAILHAAVAHKPMTRTERFCAWLMSHLPGTMGLLPLRRRLISRLHHAPFADLPPELWEYFLSQGESIPIRAVGRRVRTLHRIDLRPILNQIRQPVLLVCGARDPVVRPERTQELLDSLPSGGRVVLESCGQFPHFTHPAGLAHVIRLFLTPPTRCSESERGETSAPSACT
jgi:pimeloyl-ACP methyl ester carboxylesterase